MNDIHELAALNGGLSRIGAQDVDRLEARLHGQLLRPGDDDYDAARTVWNGLVDKCPALILRCAGVADVIDAVNFARVFDLLVSVRCGGHNIAGKAVVEGGLMIDLSPMHGVHVDPARKIARVEGGATLGRLDRETQVFGLATTAGVVSHTGVGGLTLGGGVGRLARKYGLACDNLVSVEVVTADGGFLRASAEENEDLFWGLRGGGGNFGIATSFEFRLHEIGRHVRRAAVVHPIAAAKDALRFFRDFAFDAPDEVTAGAAFVTADDGSAMLSLSACHIAPLDAADQVIEPLTTFGGPQVSTLETIPYLRIQCDADQVFPHGQNYYWKTHFIDAMPDAAMDKLIDRFRAVPGPMSLMAFQHYGGAIRRVGPTATAFGNRDAEFDFLLVAIWRDPSESEAQIAWSRQTWEAMSPHATGGEYLNNLGDEGDDRIRAAVGDNYDRLVALKNKYDPTNFFRLNANIKPAA